MEQGGCIRGGYRMMVVGCEESVGPDPEPGDYITAAQAEVIANTYSQQARNQAEVYSDTELGDHAGDTTGVHGIADTSALETQTGAQTKANTARDEAGAAAQAALGAHAADTTNVHGILDTSQLLTQASIDDLATKDELASHEADTTAVHGIADTSALLTDADIDGLATDADVAQVQTNLDTHSGDTTAVHGIADTSALVTSTDLAGYATDADLTAHSSDTTSVHGIANTAVLETQSGAQAKADAAQSAAATDLSTHAADTTAVHGITDTAALETQTGAQTKADAAETGAVETANMWLGLHNVDTTAVHGIEDTALLETQTGAQGKVDTHNADTTAVHGIADTSALLTDADLSGMVTDAELASHAADTSTVHGLGTLNSTVTTLDGFVQDCLGRVAAIEQGTAFLDGVNSTGPVSITDDLTVTGDVNAKGVTDWLNAKTFGALGDGVTDDTAELQAAIDATPVGGMLYIPNGDYRTSAPLYPKPGAGIMMPHANLMMVPGITDPPCRIRPLASFAGDAVLVYRNQAAGGYATIPAEHRLINVMIDGQAQTTPAVDGIQAKGNIQNVVMHGVTIRYMSGNGIYTDIGADSIFPYSWRLYRVMSDNNDGHGFSFSVMTDITMFDCQAIGNASNGFNLNNLANSQMTLCRAEWNGNHGYAFVGNWGNAAGSGALVVTGCSTDRNGFDGVHVETTGTPPIVFNGLMLRRDGRNNGAGGGGYAAFSALGAKTPLVVDGLTVFPGTDDNGTGTSSPEIGLKVGTTSNVVMVDNAYIHAATTPIVEDGTTTRYQLGPNIVRATGLTSAPVLAAAQAWTWRGTATARGALAADNLLDFKVGAEAFSRALVAATGQFTFGGGTVAPDTPSWYRESAGNVRIDSYVNMNSGGQSGGAFTSWAAAAKALIAGNAGGGLSIKEGTNARMGVSTLVGGTIVVNNTSVTATTRIFLTCQTPGGTPGFLRVSARTAGTSFTILSSSGSDTSVVAWHLVEPA